MDGEQYGKDLGILWAAYQAGGFQAIKRGLDPNMFLEVLKPVLEKAVWLIEDRNKEFSTGTGPVCIASSLQEEFSVVVSGEAFPWASKRNALRCAVAYLWMLIHSGKVGVIFTKQSREMRKACNHLKEYGVLHYIGRVGEDQYLYAVRGRGSD